MVMGQPRRPTGKRLRQALGATIPTRIAIERADEQQMPGRQRVGCFTASVAQEAVTGFCMEMPLVRQFSAVGRRKISLLPNSRGLSLRRLPVLMESHACIWVHLALYPLV